MNGSEATSKDGSNPLLASGGASNGDSVASKKRKKDGLQPIVTTHSPERMDSLGYVYTFLFPCFFRYLFFYIPAGSSFENLHGRGQCSEWFAETQRGGIRSRIYTRASLRCCMFTSTMTLLL